MWDIHVNCKMLLSVDLKLSTFLVSLICFYFVLNSYFVLHLYCTIEIWQSLKISWAWSGDSFGRLSPNLCCLFELCLLKRVLLLNTYKADMTWLLKKSGKKYLSTSRKNFQHTAGFVHTRSIQNWFHISDRDVFVSHKSLQVQTHHLLPGSF